MDNKKEHSNTLFTPSGCLSLEAITKYSNNQLTKEERHSIEEHTRSCELCRDALEGIITYGDAGSFSTAVNDLHQKLSKKVTTKRKTRFLTITSLAASILILFGLILIFQNQKKGKTLVAENIKTAEEKEQPIQSGPKDKILPESTVSTREQAVKHEKQIEHPKRQHSRDIIAEDKTKDIAAGTAIGKGKIEEVQNQIVLDEIPHEFEAEMDEIELEEAIVKESDDYQPSTVVLMEANMKVTTTKKIDATDYRDETKYENNKEFFKRSVRAKSAEPLVVKSDEHIDRLHTVPEDITGLEVQYASGEPFTYVEEMPEFVYGDSHTFEEWILKTLHHPDSIVNKELTGEVYVEFIVTKDSTISNVKILKSLHPDIDTDIIEVIESSPKWKPGKQDDIPVDVIMTMKIVY